MPATNTATTKKRRVSKSAQVKPTKAQIDAMEARAANAPYDMEAAAALSVQSIADPIDPVGTIRTSAQRIKRPNLQLSREREYEIIRGDMKRLVLIAGSLFVVMLVLLFIFD